MAIRVDHRSIEAEPAPRALKEALSLFARSREVDVLLADALAEIDGKRAYAMEGCGSLEEWAASHGFDGARARELAVLGKAVDGRPDLESRLLRGEVTSPAACVVSRILAKPELVRAGEDWVERAATEPLRDLRQKVRSRIEAQRQGTDRPLGPLTFLVTDETRTGFRRARDLASREARRELSESQAFVRVTEHFLDSFDPLRAKTRPRRVGPTAERPDDRYVPASEARALDGRSGLRCEVPGCARIATERAHVRPHANGSGREAGDLWHGCHRHHVLYDAGVLAIEGFDPAGRPVFATGNGAPKRARPGGGGLRGGRNGARGPPG